MKWVAVGKWRPKGQTERAGEVGTLIPKKRSRSGGVKRRWRSKHQRKWQEGEELENDN